MACLRTFGALFLLGLLAACVSSPPPAPPTVAAKAYVAHFDLDGRLSVRDGQRGELAVLQWRRAAHGEEINLRTPLGQTVAQLTQAGASAAALRTSKEVRVGASINDLIREVLGTPVPLNELAGWIQWQIPPQAGTTGSNPFEYDGWTVWLENPQPNPQAEIAGRVTASRGDVVIKLVVDAWKPLP